MTTTIVTSQARSLTFRSTSKTSCDVVVSSSPVGSSAKSTAGSFASATAIATRCCSPPDRRSGRCSARSASPTRSSSSVARRCRLAATDAVQQHRQLDVLARGQIRQQVARRLLPDEADHATSVRVPLAPAHLAQDMAVDHGPTGRRHVEAAEDVHQRALAAARRADERDELTALDDQVETLEGDHLEVGDLVDLDQVVAQDECAVGV